MVRAAKSKAKAMDEVTGRYTRQRWASNDGTFIIGALANGTGIKGSVLKDSPLRLGSTYRFHGEWTEHPKYGKQFEFSMYTEDVPLTENGVVEYLCRILPGTGIGPVGIRKIVSRFGPEKVLEAIRETPDAVAEATGLDAAYVAQAAEVLNRHKATEKTRVELMQLLAGQGFPGTIYDTCIAKFGPGAAQILKRDPFKLMTNGIKGAGFLRVDTLYKSLNLPLNRLKRQGVCLWHAVDEVGGKSGSSWAAIRAVREHVEKLVDGVKVNFESAKTLMIRAGWLVERDGYLATTEHARSEDIVSAVAAFLAGGPKPNLPSRRASAGDEVETEDFE